MQMSHKIENIIIEEKKVDMPTILVVEDEPNVRKLVAVNLIKRGHRVLEADSGQRALEHLRDQKPALMILDIKLPDLSGWDLLDHLSNDRGLSADFPVLVMTASPIDQDTVLNQYPCEVEILRKPFNIDMLMAAIERALLKN